MLARTIDTLIAAAILAGVIGWFSIDDGQEYEAEFNPVDAKITEYCQRSQHDPRTPAAVAAACRNRNIQQFETIEDADPQPRPTRNAT